MKPRTYSTTIESILHFKHAVNEIISETVVLPHDFKLKLGKYFDRDQKQVLISVTYTEHRLSLPQ